MNVTEKFIDIIYNLSQKAISEDIAKQTERCFTDYIAVTLAGSVINYNKVKKYIKSNHGEYSLIGISEKVDINSAVIINAYNSHILELDDGHRSGMMHLGAPIFSSLLSVAEQKGCTKKDMLKGAVVGYEAAIRLASSIQPNHKQKGFHATGTCGTVGCALAIAAMLNYNKEEMQNVLSAAATSGAGLLEVITGKSQQKPYNISNAAISGVNAAMFGKYFSGPNDVLGGNRGFIKNFSDTYCKESLIEEKNDLAINGIYMKPYAACRHCHAPIEAALKLTEESNINIDNIKEVIVDTYGLAVFGHEHTNIEGVNSAKMSIPYSVAAALIYKTAGLEMFTDNKIKDKKILDLSQKVIVNENEELSKLVPNKRAAIVTVKTEDEKIKTIRVDYPKGEPENPITNDELVNKFYSLAGTRGITKEYSKKIIEFINDKDNNDKKVSELFNMLNGMEEK
jgi:2-methylcitrate dehydratase PrpD